MELDEIQTQGCKFPRIGNGIGKRGREQQYPDVDEDGGEPKRGGGGNGDIGGFGRLICGWPSSRIVRVSRATGGKDRHSKVLTSKGLRDRRVRLSVTTAIQFYDLQDRLGVDQPSKAVEWLLKAAAKSIDELPCIKASLPNTPKQLRDEKRSREQGLDDSAEMELDGDPNHNQHQQHVSLSKSGCSSTSETSKGSGLSLSRNSSSSPNGSAQQNPRGGEANFFQKTPIDYYASGFLAPSSLASRNHNSSSGFSGQIYLANSAISPFSVAGDHHHHHHHPELQHFSFAPDHFLPVASSAVAGGGSGSDYNLNFTISAGLAGMNRGTLQSNSPSLLPHLQRLSSSSHIDASNSNVNVNVPFFIGTAAPNAASLENHHHQFPHGLDGRLQLSYGDSGRHSDHKGKGKN
ncbi:hypothetical protein HYC85_018145 [Camellia sinensis]|uniref:TCP domain-containing protein n=1 Tax=Camellia sinensis TaxID=4442 RepID=A0A7J7GXE0_CAMSI|nr:hypothetical protein HYC85_018145 [Camellia sinensis]